MITPEYRGSATSEVDPNFPPMLIISNFDILTFSMTVSKYKKGQQCFLHKFMASVVSFSSFSPLYCV